MTKARELAKLGEVMTNSQIGGRRNIILNPKMEVAQRGTSFANIGTSSLAYGLDRFGIRNATDGAVTITQDTSVPNTEFLKSMKLDVTTADSSIASGQVYSVQYKVEGQDLAQLGFGQSGTRYFTISFHHKHTKTGTHCIGVTNSAGNRSYTAEYTQSVADTWEQAIIVIPVDTSGTWLTTNGVGAIIYFVVSAGSNFHGTADTWSADNTFATSNQVNNLDSTSNNFFLTGIQMEAGSYPNGTPFEHRSFGEELDLCQRYFQKSYNYGDAIANTSATSGYHVYQIDDGSLQRNGFRFTKSMRASPTVVIYNIDTGATGSARSNASVNFSTNIFGIGENGCFVNYTPSSGEYIFFHHTAEAEL